MLAGVSVDYYVRIERGSLGGASESVLEALADALQLDEAERAHLFALARESGARSNRHKRTVPTSVRPAIQQVLDAMTDAPAWVRNGGHDVLAMNQLARALYSPVLADPGVRPTPPASSTCSRRRPRSSSSTTTGSPRTPPRCSASRRAETARQGAHRAGRRAVDPVRALPHPLGLPRRQFHRSGRKRLRHPAVGQLDLDFESLEHSSEPGLQLNVCTAAAGTPTADALRLLASWAASQEDVPTERETTSAWCTRRSIMAAATMSSPKTSPHHPNGLLLVTIATPVRSGRRRDGRTGSLLRLRTGCIRLRRRRIGGSGRSEPAPLEAGRRRALERGVPPIDWRWRRAPCARLGR